MRRTEQERKAGRTWIAVADQLGVSVRSVHTWRRLDGAPREPDAAAWRAFAEDRGLNGGMTGSHAELRAEKIKEEIELLRLKRRREEGRAIALEDVQTYLKQLAARWDQVLTLKLETEIPARLVGKDIVAARAEAQAVHDEIREICNAGIVAAETTLATSP